MVDFQSVYTFLMIHSRYFRNNTGTNLHIISGITSQKSLYYGIGKYVSENSRNGFWGKGAIETISEQLQKELPGLRGFSAANIKFMRQFYGTWCEDLKSLTGASGIGDDKSLT